MSFTTFAIVYVFGGLTFIPLLLAAILLPAWYWLPRKDIGPAGGTDNATKAKGTVLEQDEKYAAADNHGHDSYGTGEGSAAAEATFAVLRSYHFPSALTALNARASGAANGVAGSNGSTDGAVGDAGGSGGQSVYQSMYRTVFDRGKTSADTTTSVLAKDGNGITREEEPSKLGRKAVVSASVFHIVLRHGHLMLYDSPAHHEVRHVISLAHHKISITDGEQDVLPDGDLFIKRTAIVLTPIHETLPNGVQAGHQAVPHSARPKPFYLFSSTCIEKEDFYHALLSTRASPPIPRSIAPEDLIKLQSTLHSTSLTAETRAFNALIGRIFLAFHRTSFLEQEIRTRIEKKIARVQKPTFIASLDVESIDLGSSSPILSQPRLKDINISGDITVAFDLRYAGGVRVGIAAVAKIDLGTRFKPRSVDLVLSTSIQRFSGKMLVRIKPPPSNRIWFCFEAAPDMEIKVEPVVSSRQITYAFILRAIEERIRAVVAETLVKPNWDDIPFFDTRGQRVRGGMWSDEGALEKDFEDQEVGSVAKSSLEQSEKSASMPALSAAVDAFNAAGASSESDTPAGKLADSAASSSTDLPGKLKRRSVASLPLKHAATMRPDMAPPPPSTRPLRSPSFTSPSPSTPIVAVDDASGVPVRSDDASLQPKKWRAAAQSASRKEAVQAVREMRDRSMPASLSSERAEDIAAPNTPDPDTDVDADTEPRTLFEDSSHASASRSDTMRSAASTASSSSSRQSPNQRKNLIAATAAATTAARNWGWNAIQARTAAGRGGPRQPMFRGAGTASQTSLPPDQPMGRGQPLPPPGTPLPGPQHGPQKGLFAGIGSVVGGKGGIKRKPVLPPRSAGAQGSSGGLGSGAANASETSLASDGRLSSETSTGLDTAGLPLDREAVGEVEDDFGPWRENSGREGLYEGRGWVFGSTTAEQTGEVASLDETEQSTAPSIADSGQHDDINEQTSIEPPAERNAPPPLPARRPTERVKESETTADDDAAAGDMDGDDHGKESMSSLARRLANDDGIRIRGHDGILSEESKVADQRKPRVQEKVSGT